MTNFRNIQTSHQQTFNLMVWLKLISRSEFMHSSKWNDSNFINRPSTSTTCQDGRFSEALSFPSHRSQRSSTSCHPCVLQAGRIINVCVFDYFWQTSVSWRFSNVGPFVFAFHLPAQSDHYIWIFQEYGSRYHRVNMHWLKHVLKVTIVISGGVSYIFCRSPTVYVNMQYLRYAL